MRGLTFWGAGILCASIGIAAQARQLSIDNCEQAASTPRATQKIAEQSKFHRSPWRHLRAHGELWQLRWQQWLLTEAPPSTEAFAEARSRQAVREEHRIRAFEIYEESLGEIVSIFLADLRHPLLLPGAAPRNESERVLWEYAQADLLWREADWHYLNVDLRRVEWEAVRDTLALEQAQLADSLHVLPSSEREERLDKLTSRYEFTLTKLATLRQQVAEFVPVPDAALLLTRLATGLNR